MALSPNYSWAEPDNSSLVKNGAADIRTLGDSIDTSVWNVGYGQAGKNKVINGDFGIWQRGTSLTVSTQNQFLADRWRVNYGVALPTSWTISQQAFTAGTAPVAGYEGTFFMRSAITTIGSAVSCRLVNPIEDVRTYAGQTVTLSFWAKADSSRTIVAYLTQNFGSGGSTSVNTSLESVAVTTGWVRYTRTWTLASIAGKTIGTANALEVRLQNPDTASTIDYWGVQLEYGSKATPFQTATGTIQGELAACQRYYIEYGGDKIFERFGGGSTDALTSGRVFTNMPVPMRTTPSMTTTTTDWQLVRPGIAGVALTALTLSTDESSTKIAALTATIASTAGFGDSKAVVLCANSSTSARIRLSAEL